jgi:hypothetical protein
MDYKESRFVAIRPAKTALPFDLVYCTLAFSEFRHGLLSVVFAAPGEMIRLA